MSFYYIYLMPLMQNSQTNTNTAYIDDSTGVKPHN